jgi:signal transduction histidine kinase
VPGAPRSILTRILAGLLLVILGFGGVTAFSAWQHHRTVRSMELVNQNYFRLTLKVAEIRRIQSHFPTTLDGLRVQEMQALPLWLRLARRVRPDQLAKFQEQLDSMDRSRLPDEEARFVARTSEAVEEVRRLVDANEERYGAVEAALAARDPLRTEGTVEEANTAEREIDQKMSLLQQSLKTHITDLGDRAEEDEQTGLLAFLVLAAAALVVGVVVTILSHRLLSPLRRLQEGAEAVTKGDLSQRLRIDRADEIGALAHAFDAMLDAIVARDALVRRQAEELVRSERLAAIGRMASHITHEVRNPLSSIGLNVELLEEEVAGLGGGEATKEARDLLGAIAKEVDRLTALTKDYLRLARVPRPTLEVVDLGELVRSVLDFAGGELRRSGITVGVRVGEDLGAIPLDESQLRQVLLNLVRNAREAMPEGGTLRVSASRQGEAVEIAVEDTGAGVPGDERERIFEPFHTSKAQGTGLGLPLAMQLVRGHGGTLRLESPAGGGARFVVRLPIGAGEPAKGPDPLVEERA